MKTTVQELSNQFEFVGQVGGTKVWRLRLDFMTTWVPHMKGFVSPGLAARKSVLSCVPTITNIFNPVNDNKYSPEGRGILSPLTMVISTSESLRSGNELAKKKRKQYQRKISFNFHAVRKV